MPVAVPGCLLWGFLEMSSAFDATASRVTPDTRWRKSSGAPAPAAERFHLVKWYLDCVGERGDALILYWAELRWRRIALHYASATLYADGGVSERSALRAGPAPSSAGGNLEWSCVALDAGGVWSGAVRSPIERVLLRRGRGKLEWRCTQPMAEASVHFGGRRICGRGYTERITLTMAPWQLPIEELRWGRAHFPGRCVVWIDWTGPEPMRLVLVDGMEVEATAVNDALVSTPRIVVRLAGSRVLREGPFAGTSAGSVPGVRRALSKAGLLLEEHKWLSSATLEDGGAVLPGESIHEVVRWR